MTTGLCGHVPCDCGIVLLGCVSMVLCDSNGVNIGRDGVAIAIWYVAMILHCVAIVIARVLCGHRL